METYPADLENKTSIMMKLVTSIIKTFHETQDFEQGCEIINRNNEHALSFIFVGAKTSDMGKLLTNLMRTTWNCMPLASHQYKISPLPELRRNDKCWCGSNLKYKQCCQRNNISVPIDSDFVWSQLLSELSSNEIQEAVSQHAIPTALLVSEAIEDIENGRNQDALKKLEPIFSQNLDKVKPEVCYAVSILSNIYDDLGMIDKKLIFLNNIKNTGSKPLRSEAWQRLATIYIDQGDLDDAWDAFHTARHLDPSNSGVDLLEITLLMGSKELDKAQERAKFILRRLRRDGLYDDSDATQFLEVIANNPTVGLEMFLGGSEQNQVIDKLSNWVKSVENHPIQNYKITELPPFDIESELGNSYQASQSNLTYEAPTKVSKLEKKWNNIFQGVDTFGINTLPTNVSDIWDGDGAWVDFLQDHPECFNSINIIDDIILALEDWERDEFILNKLLMPLGKRVLDIYKKFPKSGAFSWLMHENRPLVRVLYNYTDTLNLAGDTNASFQLLEKILEINSNDNHSIRRTLMNAYLHQQNHEKIEILLQMFPEDILIDMQMGKVLYLLQKDEEAKARKHWKNIQSRYPYIKRYMTNTSLVEPEQSEYGIAVGSKEESWLYNEMIRPIWLKQRGSIGWLKKH